MYTLDDLSEPAPPPGPDDWNDKGVVILKNFLDHDAMNDYEKEWLENNADRPGGWPYCTPYMEHAALRRLVCDEGLAVELAKLMGEPAGVHLNLSGWVTTERDWHQDTYLNPLHVGDKYAAVWMALQDIHPDSGPFQYVPGSHRWHTLTRDKIGEVVDLSNPEWPKHSEDVLSPLVEDEIKARGAKVKTYLPERGDVLIWHGRLYHRGSKANVQGMERRALIAHYSGIHHRQDMPPAIQSRNGGFLFPIQGGPV